MLQQLKKLLQSLAFKWENWKKYCINIGKVMTSKTQSWGWTHFWLVNVEWFRILYIIISVWSLEFWQNSSKYINLLLNSFIGTLFTNNNITSLALTHNSYTFSNLYKHVYNFCDKLKWYHLYKRIMYNGRSKILFTPYTYIVISLIKLVHYQLYSSLTTFAMLINFSHMDVSWHTLNFCSYFNLI